MSYVSLGSRPAAAWVVGDDTAFLKHRKEPHYEFGTRKSHHFRGFIGRGSHGCHRVVVSRAKTVLKANQVKAIALLAEQAAALN
jgi:hypothetical protein